MRRLTRAIILLSLMCACGDSEEDSGEEATTGDDIVEPSELPASDVDPSPSDPGTVEPDDIPISPDPGTTLDPGTEDTQPEGPHIVVEPTVVNFTSTKIGETQNASFVIRNNGTEKVNITGASFVSGAGEGFDFLLEPPTGLLVPGEKRTIDMKFTSAELGSHTAILAFDTLPDTGGAQAFLKAVVSLQIQAVPVLQPSMPAVRFGAVATGETAVADVELLNVGTDSLIIEDLGWLDAPAAGVQLVVEELPVLLGPGSKIELTLSWTPDAKGSTAGILQVLSNSETTPVLTLPVTGAAGAECDGILSCGLETLEFGTVATGAIDGRSLVCRNTGTGALEVSALTADLALADGFSTHIPELPLTLQPSAALAVPITFAPTVEGDVSGTVEVETASCNGGKQTIVVKASSVSAKTPPPCGVLAPMEASLEWEWTSSDGFGRVVSAPIVADVDADGEVEIVFVGHETSLSLSLAGDQPGRLRALNGADGSLEWTATTQPTWAGQLAAGDLDGRPGLEIVAIAYAPSPEGQSCPGVLEVIPAPFCSKFLIGRLIAIDGKTGDLRWTSEPFNGAAIDLARAGAPAITDLNNDGLAEVVLGNHVFRGHDGRLLWAGSSGRGSEGHGFMTTAADVDQNGAVELVAGNTAYRAGGTIAWTSTIGDSNASAPADLDGNGTVEVFVNGSNGNSVIIDGKTGQVVTGPVNTGLIGCCNAAPVVADLTSSSAGLEIVTVGDDQLKVFDQFLELLWSRPIDDPDGAAGAIAFDFDGNGLSELVYADRSAAFILRGADGQVLMEIARPSTTGLDLPVVADVDGDGRAELLLTVDGGEAGGPGLRLYRNAADTWVGARPIWNQHSFAPRSVFDSGAIPRGGEEASLGPIVLRSTPPNCL